MIDIFKKKKSLLIAFAVLTVFISSFALGIHNATLYNPSHGFDGGGHVYYIKYLYKYRQIPNPNLEWETHQSPLYYVVGALLMTVTGTWKTAQYINIFILWMIIGMVGLGLRKVLKAKDQVLIGMFSLAALPMLNIFPAMITNELLNTFWIISIAVSGLYIISAKKTKEFILYSIWFGVSFILGIWTKVSVFLILPTIIAAYTVCFIRNQIKRKVILVGILSLIIFITAFSTPILLRANSSKIGSNVFKAAAAAPTITLGHPLEFYFRLDWIPKVDMYNTQYYSMLGGAWNSFWTDGHNAITPFVKFHKKSFVIWSLGFLLLPLCLYGLWKLSKTHKDQSLILNILGITMLVMYVYYNLNNHYSGARLTYEMGIVVPYAFGLATSAKGKKTKILIMILLSVQFVVMVSFYWILPWWHVTK